MIANLDVRLTAQGMSPSAVRSIMDDLATAAAKSCLQIGGQLLLKLSRSIKVIVFTGHGGNLPWCGLPCQAALPRRPSTLASRCEG